MDSMAAVECGGFVLLGRRGGRRSGGTAVGHGQSGADRAVHCLAMPHFTHECHNEMFELRASSCIRSTDVFSYV
jgi:hypothetical protein